MLLPKRRLANKECVLDVIFLCQALNCQTGESLSYLLAHPKNLKKLKPKPSSRARATERKIVLCWLKKRGNAVHRRRIRQKAGTNVGQRRWMEPGKDAERGWSILLMLCCIHKQYYYLFFAQRKTQTLREKARSNLHQVLRIILNENITRDSW